MQIDELMITAWQTKDQDSVTNESFSNFWLNHLLKSDPGNTKQKPNLHSSLVKLPISPQQLKSQSILQRVPVKTGYSLTPKLATLARARTRNIWQRKDEVQMKLLKAEDQTKTILIQNKLSYQGKRASVLNLNLRFDQTYYDLESTSNRKREPKLKIQTKKSINPISLMERAQFSLNNLNQNQISNEQSIAQISSRLNLCFKKKIFD